MQENSVERLDGKNLYHHENDKYIPNCLVARNSYGETISITALIKTQGSDTKLFAQMQPYYEAKSRERYKIRDIEIPYCVLQIADGENGEVMMNEFPNKFNPVWNQIKEEGDVVGFKGIEWYIELLKTTGLNSDDYPTCQAVGQHKIWNKIDLNNVTPESVAKAIEELQVTDCRSHIDGASWTDNLSWVNGYENVLKPMNRLSTDFLWKSDF